MSKERWTSTVVRNAIDIPSDKPAVEKILRCKATPEISRTSVIPRKVIYWGCLDLEIEYATQAVNGQIHAMIAKVPITGFLICNKAKRGFEATLTVETEFVSLDVIKPRVINTFILVRFKITRVAPIQIEVVPDIIEPYQKSMEHEETAVFTGPFRRPTRIRAWTRKQRY